MKKIISFNLILIIILFSFSELYFYEIFKKKANITRNCFIQKNFKDSMRDFPPAGMAYSVVDNEIINPILLLGCSYTQGQGLEKEESISYILAKNTGRTVYNMAQSGYGAGMALTYLLQENIDHSTLNNNKIDTFIYTYMFHHIQRMNQWNFYNVYRKMGYIPFQKYNILYKSYTYQYIKNIQLDNWFKNDTNLEKRLKLFFNLMKDIKKESEKISPNSKFIILIYNDINYDLCKPIIFSFYDKKEDVQLAFNIMESKEFKSKLEKLGYIVIYTEELIGRKMDKPEDRLQNDISKPHPAKHIWNIIVPLLIKKLSL